MIDGRLRSSSIYSLISADSCKDPNNLMVFIGSLNNFEGPSIVRLGPKGNEECNQRCIPKSPHITTVENCQVHFYEAQRDEQINSDSEKFEANLYCLACKPGYKAMEINTTNQIITKCIPIENCLLEDKQVWMNNCSQCEEKYLYRFDAKDYIVKMDECVKNESGVEYCQLENEGQCVMCANGTYLNTDGKCVDKDDDCIGTSFIDRIRFLDDIRYEYLNQILDNQGIHNNAQIFKILIFLMIFMINHFLLNNLHSCI